MDRISGLGATVYNTPSPEELPALIARVARYWAEIHEADPALAMELARKLPETKITRSAGPEGN